MEHYFTHKPASKKKVTQITETVRGNTLTFKTSTSVFAKGKLDYGTRLLIETVKVCPADALLDLGCGYGAIGISLSFFCNLVVLLDINERGCHLTKENININKVSNSYVVCGTPSCLQYPFDVVAMNPPLRAGKKIVFSLIKESKRLLKKEGTLYLVARTRQGAKSIYAFVQDIFDQVEYAALKGGYRVIEGKST